MAEQAEGCSAVQPTLHCVNIFSGQEDFSNRTLSPLRWTWQQRLRAVCQVQDKTNLHWLVWLEPTWCFLRPSVKNVTEHGRGGVFMVVSLRPDLCVCITPKTESKLIRNWGCFNSWVPFLTFQGLLIQSARGLNECSYLYFAFSPKRRVQWLSEELRG